MFFKQGAKMQLKLLQIRKQLSFLAKNTPFSEKRLFVAQTTQCENVRCFRTNFCVFLDTFCLPKRQKANKNTPKMECTPKASNFWGAHQKRGVCDFFSIVVIFRNSTYCTPRYLRHPSPKEHSRHNSFCRSSCTEQAPRSLPVLRIVAKTRTDWHWKNRA